jgi:hypothetical protein
MRNLIHVIYPDEGVHSYVIESEEGIDNLLERVFAEWNRGSGSECELFLNNRCRSLSVNDVVVVNGRYYQCSFIGWNEISHQYLIDLEDEVSDHRYRDLGAWYALGEVMWERRKNEKKECVEA